MEAMRFLNALQDGTIGLINEIWTLVGGPVKPVRIRGVVTSRNRSMDVQHASVHGAGTTRVPISEMGKPKARFRA